jgi:lysophospholipase L1-like esterase
MCAGNVEQAMSDLTREIQRRLHRARYPAPVRCARAILLCILLIATLLVVGELAARLLGTAPPSATPREQRALWVQSVHELNDRFDCDAFVADDWLLWRLQPSAAFYGHVITPRGFVAEPLPHRSGHTPDLVVVVLGDSVPAAAYRTFPEIAQRLMEAGDLQRMPRVINAAVPGYSSEQILRWSARLTVPAPDVVVICAGAADSLPSFGLPDRLLGFSSPEVRRVLGALSRSHLIRTLVYGSRASAEREQAAGARVAPERFERNLMALVQAAQRHAACPVLFTEPVPDQPAALPARPTDDAAQAADALRRRRLYNDIVRRVALATRAELVDLDQETHRRGQAVLVQADGVHLSPAGQNLAARLLIGAIRRTGLISDTEFTRVIERARYDTTAPDSPRVLWSLWPTFTDVPTSATVLPLGVLASNVGNTVWLRRHVVPRMGRASDVSFGSTWIAAGWQPSSGPVGETTVAVQRFALPHDVLPGETTSQTLPLVLPRQAGTHVLRLGLDVDGIGPLARFGAEETSLTVTLH